MMQKMFKKLDENINAENILLFLLVSLGSFLRLYKLDNKGLWGDEIGEVIAASSNNISGVLSGASHHLSPPLDYIVLHFFLHFGISDFIVRLPSAIFGILSIILIYYVAKTLFGPKEGLISAFLLAISPMHIFYSQETRMYSLFVFLSLFSLLFFIKAINEDSVLAWIGFIISTALNIYTHYFAFFVILIYIFFIITMAYKNRCNFTENNMFSKSSCKNVLLHFVSSVLIIFLLYIPQIHTFLMQTSSLKGILPYGLPATLYFFEIVLYKMGPWNIPGLVVYIGFFVIGLSYIFKNRHKNQMMLLIFWMFIPILISFIITYIKGPMTTYRNLIFILPIFLILISEGIMNISHSLNEKIQSVRRYNLNNNTIIVLILILIIIFTFTNTNIYNLYNFQNKGDKDTGIYLTTHVKSNDFIVVFGQQNSEFEYYYKGNSDIAYIEKNMQSVYTLLNNISDINYDKIWFVHYNTNKESNNLSTWLDICCELNKEGTSQNLFKLHNIDEKVQKLMNIEYQTKIQRPPIYTFDMNNTSTKNQSSNSNLLNLKKIGVDEVGVDAATSV